MIIDIKTFESVLHSSIRNNKFHDFLLKFKHVLKDHDSGGMLDWYFWKNRLAPQWWMKLRVLLTGIVVLLLSAGVF